MNIVDLWLESRKRKDPMIEHFEKCIRKKYDVNVDGEKEQ